VNAEGQRPVENIVASAVSLRYGGVQPASTERVDMFGVDAPVWRFLAQFGGPADPCAADLFTASRATRVIETYPVLAAITLGWALEDARATGRLAKYNPDRRTFTRADWKHLCGKAADAGQSEPHSRRASPIRCRR
jgi:predicted RNase H-like nuclease